MTLIVKKLESLLILIHTLKSDLKIKKIKISSSVEYDRLKKSYYRLAIKSGLKPSLKLAEKINLDNLLNTIHALKSDLKIKKLKTSSSAEYDRLKKLYYRLAIMSGLKPSLKFGKSSVNNLKKNLDDKEKKVQNVHVLRDKILSLRAQIKKSGATLASSAEYLRVKEAYYYLTKKLGVDSSLRLIKVKSTLPSFLGTFPLSEAQKLAITKRRAALEELKMHGTSEEWAAYNQRLKNGTPAEWAAFDASPCNASLSDYGYTIKHAALASLPVANVPKSVSIKHAALASLPVANVPKSVSIKSSRPPIERFDQVTAQVRSNYVLNQNVGRFKGYFDTPEKKAARHTAFIKFFKGEDMGDFYDEDLLESEILNDFHPLENQAPYSGEAFDFLEKQLPILSSEIDKLVLEKQKRAKKLNSKSSRYLEKNFWALSGLLENTQRNMYLLPIKILNLKRVEDILRTQIELALSPSEDT
jgi:hypothetical protein